MIRFGIYAMIYAPIVMLWLALCYLLIFGLYLVHHPDALVGVAFKAVRAIPNYTAWASEQMWNRVAFELQQSLR